MNYKNYVKKLILPLNGNAPSKLEYDDLIAVPLTRNDLQADMKAVNSSLQVIRKTRGGSWPSEAVSEEFDLLDLAWHEREFRDHDSFAYVVYSGKGEYVGCFYLYGIGLRTELTPTLADFEVDASWWVTTEAYQSGYYVKLQDALNNWLVNEFKFTKIYYSNLEF